MSHEKFHSDRATEKHVIILRAAVVTGRAQRAVSAGEQPVRGHELAGETEALLAVERVQAARA